MNKKMNTTAKRHFKDGLFEQFARIGKALSSGRRLELLELLAQAERTVEDLAAETAQSVANTSQHLQVLRQAQLVETRREGKYIRYRLADENVLRLWLALRDLGETRLAEIGRLVQTFLNDRGSLQPVTCAELQKRIKDGSAVVLDVRPAEEYEAGHISGARSIPVMELRARMKEVPRNRLVVAYCRGPYCVFADQAVTLLRGAGYRAFRLERGFPDWQIQGMPVQNSRKEM
jgi:rhodanese-related sulfurtransferase/DNA-binding transcriptional ArsR family regulator